MENDGIRSTEWELEHAMDAAHKKAEEIGASKAIIIILNDNDADYNLHWFNVGMRLPEAVSVLSIAKQDIVNNILIRSPEDEDA